MCVCIFSYPACEGRVQYYIVICGLSIYTIPFSAVSDKRQYFREIFSNIKFVSFLYKLCLKHFLFQEEFSAILSYICKRLHIKYPLFLSYFYETWIFSTDFRKNSNIKFYENSSCGGRVVPYGKTEAWTDMVKLRVAFRNFANAPKKEKSVKSKRQFSLDMSLRQFVYNLQIRWEESKSW
jgi:hypothetical protein